MAYPSPYPGWCRRCGVEWRVRGRPCAECGRRRARQWTRDHPDRNREKVATHRKRQAIRYWQEAGQ